MGFYDDRVLPHIITVVMKGEPKISGWLAEGVAVKDAAAA